MLFQRRVILILMIVFGFGSAGQITPASAAEPSRPKAKSITQIFLDIHLPKEPVCVNQPSHVLVIAKADTDALLPKGKVSHIKEEPQTGVSIESHSTNPDIATLSPRTLISGWDVEGNPGDAYFAIEAKKAGTTILRFTPKYAGKTHEIKEIALRVANCEYKVTMNATDIDSRGGVTIWTIGHLDTKIKGEGGEMEGSGSFDFDSGFVGPPCSISYSEFQNATTVTGQITEDDQLKLNFAYQPGQITSKVSCPGAGGSGSQTVDLTNTGIASATFPATGGSRMLRFTYAGSDMAPGTMIINVQPVSEQAGG